MAAEHAASFEKLVEELQYDLESCLGTIDEMGDHLIIAPDQTKRRVAIVQTKIEEAQLWLTKLA